MLNRAIYPLRSTVGPSIPISLKPDGSPDITVLRDSQSAHQLSLKYSFKARATFASGLQDSDYQKFFPRYTGTSQLQSGAGVSDVTFPPDLPFSQDESSVSLMTLATDASGSPPAAFEVSLLIKLQRKALVGGIVFGGHPFLPCVLDASGESVFNFGLPREWRLGVSGASSDSSGASFDSAFLDAETFVTRQELLSHSGVQFLSCDPTKADSLTLTLCNWPRFFGDVQLGGLHLQQDQRRFGFLVPYLYVFEYAEGTRYHPGVSLGLLAARNDPPPPSLQAQAQQLEEKQELILTHGGRYFPLSPASLMSGSRQVTIPADSTFSGASFKECYVSNVLAPNKSAVLFLEQAQEFSRCLSGLRILSLSAPDAKLKSDPAAAGNAIIKLLDPTLPGGPALNSIGASYKVIVRVWEVDPPEGIAPTQVTLGSKYTVLLAESKPAAGDQALAASQSGIRFDRPTAARYLALELINGEADNRRIVAFSLAFVQSAHVFVPSRPSRFQHIRAVNFRLVGDTLGEDLSRIGSDGFNFAIEHWAAGERKSVLFQAVSVFDLIHAGVGRIQVNARRRAAEFETAEYGSDVDKRIGDPRRNFDQRSSKNFSTSWHRSEMDKSLVWAGDADFGPEQNKNAQGFFDFVAASNQETRTRVEFVFPDTSHPEWNSAAIFANLLQNAFQPTTIATGANLLPTYVSSAHGGNQQLVAGFGRAWQGFSNDDLKKLQITGMTGVVQSPFSLTAIAGSDVNTFVNSVKDVIDVVHQIMQGQVDPNTLTHAFIDSATASGIAALIGLMLTPGVGGAVQTLLGTAMSLNGLTINVSATAAGLGATFGAAPGNLFPVVTQSASTGDQGTISKQATQSNFSYSQVLATTGENSHGTVYSEAGLMKRLVIRAEVPGNQKRVRGAEVAWQDRVTDVISGIIPVDLLLPALATKGSFRTSDECIRVRLGSGIGTGLQVEFWFDVAEEMVRDDH